MNTFLEYTVIILGILMLILRTADVNLNSRVEIYLKSRLKPEDAKWVYKLYLFLGLIFWFYFISVLIN